MAILKNTYPLLAVLTLTGCFEEFTPDVSPEPVLCINSLITAGKPIEVQVSRTWFHGDTQAANDHSVSDAEISIYVNEALETPDYIPQEGDRVKIMARSTTYGTAEAEVTVPFSIPLTEVKYSISQPRCWKEDITNYDMAAGLEFNLMVEMDINDPSTINNYYQLSFESYYNGTGETGDGYTSSHPLVHSLTTGTFNYEAEPIFAEHIGIFESCTGSDASGFTFFTDRQFSGSCYTLHLQFTGVSYHVISKAYDEQLMDCGIEFTLNSVSSSYYNWANYVWQDNDGLIGDMGNIGLGDPIWAYSNVSTDAGVVAAQSCSVYHLNLKEVIQDILARQ